jgi:uncharacterized protein YbjT (DUF2867 family)
MSHSSTFPAFVFGATGAQGGAVLRRLVAEGRRPVIGLARNGAEAEAIRAAGAEPRVADFEDEDSLRRALAGVGPVFLSLPLGLPTATVRDWGRRVIVVARGAGVAGPVVFNTGTRIPPEPTGVDAFEEKREVEEALAASGLSFVSVRPSFYFGNLAGPWIAPGIVNDGVLAYPLPQALRASWIGWNGMAACVAAAMERPALLGQRIDIGGPEALDGDALAARLGAALGRSMAYRPTPPDAFEAGLAAAIGPEAAQSVGALYRWIAARPETGLFTSDGEALAERFGAPLEALADWAAGHPWPAPVAAGVA